MRTAILAAACLLIVSSCASSTTETVANLNNPLLSEPAIEEDSDLAFASESLTLLMVSVHVEGWGKKHYNSEEFRNHSEIILRIAREAHQAGGILSFELSSEFATAPGAKEIAAQLIALGHSIEVHADVGGIGKPSLETFTGQLTEDFSELELLGVTPLLVSGICSRGPFIEAAAAAGFRIVTGIVEYCLMSLDKDYQPTDWRQEECATPAQCHDNPDFELSQRATPWRTSSSSSWIIHDSDGDLVVIAGESGTTISCLTELKDNLNSCEYEQSDITAFRELVETYVQHDAESKDEHCCVFSTALSVGKSPPPGWVTSLVSSVKGLVTSGKAAWATPREVLNRGS